MSIKAEPHGWLAPNGDFYPVEMHGHYSAAIELTWDLFSKDLVNPERFLEDNGWAKLSGRRWLMENWSDVTQSQIDFIFDWSIYNNLKMPRALEIMLDEE
jgi:hypothetical protein